VELHDAVRPALKAIRLFLPGQQALRVHPPDAPLPVRADAALLQHALVNLALNARDAMPRGGTLEISLGRAARGGAEWARLQVRDTGVGMDAAILARAGEPLFTTKPPGQGTGLGLSNVRATLAQHGGEVELTSAPGEGTCVTLWLPLAEVPVVAGANPAA